jgi:acetate kinase
MKILVLNAGSSSLKYSLISLENRQVMFCGLIERIGEAQSLHRYRSEDGNEQNSQHSIVDHQQALQELFAALDGSQLLQPGELACIGHRVVHGGEAFCQPARITPEVIAQIEAMIPLAPLHNPANLLGIREAMRLAGDLPQVAVFDTAFHQTLPEYAYRYPLPEQYYRQQGVRRYGFHGSSHAFVAKQAAEFLGKPLADCNLITLHLGNGASATAIRGGISVETSMGMTPLEGLMMGTRSGDIDPAIPFYLGRSVGLSSQEIETLFNKNSGCKGICGENDMRAIHNMADAGDAKAQLALAMYAYRIKKYIGAYCAVLGRVDALVFTGGIGENDAWLRQACCQDLSVFGIEIDASRNQDPARPVARISSDLAKIAVLVIATNEELEIAIQAQACLALA